MEAIVRLATDGDRDAARDLCVRLAPAIRAFARRRMRDPGSVDDFVQDVLVTLVQALRAGRVRDPAHVAPFALGICRNFARDRARTQERRAAAVNVDLTDVTLPIEPLLLGDARLEDCLSMLTQRAREVLQASFYDDRSDADIATALDTSAGNVRVIRHRSLAALRDCVEATETSWEAR